MKYGNDNLAAYIPQHVAHRKPARGPSAKKHGREPWAERQTPVKRRPSFYKAGRSYLPHDDDLGLEPPETPAVKPAARRTAANAASAANAAHTAHAPASPQKTAQPERESGTLAGLFSLRALLVVLLITGFAIFAYNALLWQRNYAELMPADDGLAETELRNYAYAVQPPAGESDTIPLPATETFAWNEYRVKKGDTISQIAASFGLAMDSVIVSNNISRARALREGETLRIPNIDGIPVTVRKGDTLARLSSSLGVPVTAILDANDLASETLTEGAMLFIPGARMKGEELRAVIGDLFIYPVRGRLTSPFGWRSDPISGDRRFHAAIDLAVSQGTPVNAAMSGRVSSVGFNGTYGNYIIITHAGGFTTMYAHLSKVGVEQGQQVSQGREIGKAGSTGYSTGPHLHFAVYKNNRALNPLDYLKF